MNDQADQCCLNVLILEDEVDICDLIEFAVTDLGLTALKAHNIEEAIHHLKNNKVAFGYFDYHLEDGSNPFDESNKEFLALLKSLPDFEFVIITGDYDVDSDIVDEIKIQKIFHKPLSCEELQIILKEFLFAKRDKICLFKNRTCPVQLQ
ncbi:MAG: hypothetical protein KDD50_12410 [Bdellovibrionales bacterium]|nr:hypothetical protein [Bdellovibrionales bacterium]